MKIGTIYIAISGLLTSFTLVAANTNAIEPSSGTWQPKIASHQESGCPAMMQVALSQSKIDTTTKAIKFTQPFHPSNVFDPKDINPEGDPNVKWANTKPNYSEITILNNQEGMEINATWALKVTSVTSMDVTSKLSMKFPEEMASFMGSSECRVDSTGIIKRIAD